MTTTHTRIGGRFKAGHKHSAAVLVKIAASKVGSTPWNKGKKTGIAPANKKAGVHINCGNCGCDMRIEPNQVGRKKFCSKPCFYAGRELKATFTHGHVDLVPASSRGHSPETREMMKAVNRANRKVGAESPHWRGGQRSERKQAMGSYEYRDWRESVFARDNWTCQCCGKRGGYLEADHIKPWCAFPALRYEVQNGRTLCRPCRVKQDTHGRKALKFMESAHG